MARTPHFGGFWKADDLLEGPVTLTIKSIDEEEVGQDKALKYVIRFEDDPRGVTMGPAIYDQLVALRDSRDLDDMPGLAVELYRDPSVMFGGKRVGGVRFRAPK